MAKPAPVMFRKLLPNSTAPRLEQYAAAWDALVNHPEDYPPEDRAHAKCWLTYRAIDGEVTGADWLAKIQPVTITVPDDGLAARWRVSQTTAEIYLGILRLPSLPWEEQANSLIEWTPEALQLWPGQATNLIRVAALHAYQSYLRGYSHTAIAQVEATLGHWQKMWATLDFRERPLRFAETRADVAALHALVLIYKNAGGPWHARFPDDAGWADPLISEQKNDWWRCLVQLGRRDKTLWI